MKPRLGEPGSEAAEAGVHDWSLINDCQLIGIFDDESSMDSSVPGFASTYGPLLQPQPCA